MGPFLVFFAAGSVFFFPFFPSAGGGTTAAVDAAVGAVAELVSAAGISLFLSVAVCETFPVLLSLLSCWWWW